MSTFPYRNDLLAPFLALPQGDKVQAECKIFPSYTACDSLICLSDVWIDGDGSLRSKTTV